MWANILLTVLIIAAIALIMYVYVFYPLRGKK